MIRRIGALSAALAVATIGLVGVGASLLGLPDAPAGATSSAKCATGVIVAADFATWGGNVDAVCVTPLPSRATEALVVGGFDPVGVAQYGLSFICTIAGYPQNEDCNTTPSGKAYWSFWYARAGKNTWTYSQLGAASLAPKAGSVEGWAFGGASAAHPPPGFPSPDSVRKEIPRTPPASTTTTSPPTTTTTTSSSTTVTRTSSVGSGAPAGKKGATTTPTTAGTDKRGGKTSTTEHPSHTVTTDKTPNGPEKTSGHEAGSTDPTARSSEVGKTKKGSRLPADRPATGEHASVTPRIVDAAPAVAAQPSVGSPLPFVIGFLVVLLVGGTAALVTWRRRRTEGG